MTQLVEPSVGGSSWQRAKRRLAHSIKLRLVLVFLLLAAAMTLVFVTGAQRAFSVGWREAARPLMMDYVDRLAADITLDANQPPSVQRALSITQKLPLTIDIEGPVVNWRSHPQHAQRGWEHRSPDMAPGKAADQMDGDETRGWQTLLQRTTADGHTIRFGINDEVFERRPRLLGLALVALLLLTLLAWWYVRTLLKPLDAIGAGARRFGSGNFSQPIAVSPRRRTDELGELATTINTMGDDIRHMLDAKRALLLAISHELRSPLTRARLNTELLPDGPDVTPQRDALLRDLQEMANLISDLLESERLAGRHAALQREPVDLVALAREVIRDLQARHAQAASVHLQADHMLPALSLDKSRVRLLLRNLLDNALRHSSDAAHMPEVGLKPVEHHGQLCIELTVRDHGPGVPDDQLPHLAQPFHRPDSARTRSHGGVGLGLYLCKLVALAHGGSFRVHNAQPGLVVTVTLPGHL